MVNGLTKYGLSQNQNVKVQSSSGYTTEDMLDIVKPAAWRKTDMIIIHAGTNDITRGKKYSRMNPLKFVEDSL